MKRFSLLLFLFLVLTGFKLPGYSGYVNDYAAMFSPADKQKINSLATQIGDAGLAEIAVLTVDEIENADIRGFTQAVFDDWKIGKKGKDNGLLIVIAKKNKKIRIQTGYGLEGTITDGTAGAIIDSEIAPFFRKGQFGEGVYNGITAVQKRLKGEIPPEKKEQKKQGKSSWNYLLYLILGIILINVLLSGFIGRGRGPGGWFGGGGWYGGGGGFGGFGGGGFGGFGGGSSGGGGADRDW